MLLLFCLVVWEVLSTSLCLFIALRWKNFMKSLRITNCSPLSLWTLNLIRTCRHPNMKKHVLHHGYWIVPKGHHTVCLWLLVQFQKAQKPHILLSDSRLLCLSIVLSISTWLTELEFSQERRAQVTLSLQ